MVCRLLVASFSYMQLPICVGVAMASKADTTTNTTGLIFAGLGIVVTSFYQIVRDNSAHHLHVWKKIFFLSNAGIFLICAVGADKAERA